MTINTVTKLENRLEKYPIRGVDPQTMKENIQLRKWATREFQNSKEFKEFYEKTRATADKKRRGRR